MQDDQQQSPNPPVQQPNYNPAVSRPADPATQTAPSWNVPQPQLQPPTPPARKKPRLIFAVILVLALAIGTGVFLLMHTKSPDATSPNKAGSQSSVTSIDTTSIGNTYDSFAKNGVTEFDAGHRQATLAMYSQLLDGFALSKTYYQDSAAILTGLGIARLAIDDSANKHAYQEELYLSANSYTSRVPSGITDEYFTSPAGAEKTKQVFDKYKDASLTSKVNALLTSSDGVEAEVRKNLKLPASQTLAPYIAIALNFDNSSAGQKQFANEHYMFGAEPNMWVETVGGTNYIMISKNYAQDFIADPHGYARSTIIHEFIHAQHPFTSGDLGRSIEERRAELFSGDHSAYYDAKQMFIYSEVFSGKSLYDLLNRYPTDKLSFYTNMYAQFGLKTANNILASWPSAFLGNPSTAVRDVDALSGGLDGIIQKSIVLGTSDQAAVDARMKARADKLFSVFKTKDQVLNDLSSNLDQAYGMPTAAHKMEQFVRAQY